MFFLSGKQTLPSENVVKPWPGFQCCSNSPQKYCKAYQKASSIRTQDFPMEGFTSLHWKQDAKDKKGRWPAGFCHTKSINEEMHHVCHFLQPAHGKRLAGASKEHWTLLTFEYSRPALSLRDLEVVNCRCIRVPLLLIAHFEEALQGLVFIADAFRESRGGL